MQNNIKVNFRQNYSYLYLVFPNVAFQPLLKLDKVSLSYLKNKGGLVFWGMVQIS